MSTTNGGMNPEGKLSATATVQAHLADARAKVVQFEVEVRHGSSNYTAQLDYLTDTVASLLQAIEALEHIGADVDRASKAALS